MGAKRLSIARHARGKEDNNYLGSSTKLEGKPGRGSDPTFHQSFKMMLDQ